MSGPTLISFSEFYTLSYFLIFFHSYFMIKGDAMLSGLSCRFQEGRIRSYRLINSIISEKRDVIIGRGVKKCPK